MRIAIVGAGAIGGWIGARLAHSGEQVSVLARNETLAAIRSNGLQLQSGEQTIKADVAASDRPAELGPQDLVVVALKGPALVAAAPAIAQLLGPATAVLSAMNGIPWWFFSGLHGPLMGKSLQSVDPGGVVSAEISPERVIGCVVHASCTKAAPGVSVHKMGNGMIFGEPGGAHSERITQAATAFRKAGFDITVSTRIQQDIWYKLWGNMTMNPISALTAATADRILDDPLVRSFILRVMAEAAEVGGRIGCPITESGEDRMQVTRKLGAFRTSMLQDAEAGRALEIDMLLGAPREIAGLLQLPTPEMDALHGITRLFAAVRGLNPPR